MKKTRVVQITDLHLLATPGELLYGVDTAKALEKIVTHIQSLSPKPDLIVLSGDIAQDGKAESYQRVRSIFSALDIPIYALPGNHDNVAIMRSDLVNGAIKMSFSATVDAWQFIFLDSTVDNQDYGLISETSLGELKTYLESSEHRPSLIALHHTPTFECSAADCQLQNREQFLNVIQQVGNVKGVIAGHTHCQSDQLHSDIQLMATPSAFLHVEHHSRDPDTDHSDVRLTHTIDGTRQGYRILDLSSDGQINSEVCWL